MGNVKVTISGELSGVITPIGVTITYPKSGLAIAIVDVDPTTTSLIASVDSYRHTSATITITTPSGSIKFVGFFDGLTFNQTRGGFAYQAVFKSKFQDLMYIYPRLFGVSCGTEYFCRKSVATIPPTQNDELIVNWTPNNKKIPPGPILRYYINCLISFVESQKNSSSVLQMRVSDQKQILELLQNPVYQKQLNYAESLLASIDTSAADGCILNGSSLDGFAKIQQYVTARTNNLFELLVNGLNGFGCSYFSGANTMFVVPENTFLALDTRNTPGYRQESAIINVAYPAQFTNLSFNDNGYRDIRYCVLVGPQGWITGANYQPVQTTLGLYEDKDSKSTGIVILPVPDLLSMITSGAAGIIQKDARTNLAAGNGHSLNNTNQVGDTDKSTKKEDSVVTTSSNVIEGARIKYNKWAQIKYYQLKYADRTGSILMSFNPNWCPGTSGLAYTRYPGILVDFFVDSVSHRVSLTAPNTGEATTAIQFSSGRVNGASISGADEFYNYDLAKMKKIQKSFVQDISA